MNQLRFAQLHLFIVLIAHCHSAAHDGPKRPQTILGLLTPAHIGRFWSQPQPEPHESAKRFPKFLRTGRGDSLIGAEDLVGAKDNNVNTGMWFGPRYGRLQKRNQENPWALVFSGEGNVARQVQYTPRLGRESEEVDEGMGVPRDLRAA